MRNLNLPTKLTLGRILLVPLIIILMYKPNMLTQFIAALVFTAGAITDYLDGQLARSTGSVTPVGKLLDPIADKMLILSVLIPLVSLGRISAWLATLMLAREFSVTGIRMMALTQNHVIPANWKGKWKTGFEIVAMEFLILQWTIGFISFQFIGTILLFIALFYSLWGAYNYSMEFWKLQEKIKEI